MIIGIYKIQSKLIPDRFYIGCSTDIYRRWESHLRRLELNKHTNYILQNHYNIYGRNDLEFIIIFTCKKENMYKIEMFYHDKYKPFFNLNIYFVRTVKRLNYPVNYKLVDNLMQRYNLTFEEVINDLYC